jgi:hypothetical protein
MSLTAWAGVGDAQAGKTRQREFASKHQTGWSSSNHDDVDETIAVLKRLHVAPVLAAPGWCRTTPCQIHPGWCILIPAERLERPLAV